MSGLPLLTRCRSGWTAVAVTAAAVVAAATVAVAPPWPAASSAAHASASSTPNGPSQPAPGPLPSPMVAGKVYDLDHPLVAKTTTSRPSAGTASRIAAADAGPLRPSQCLASIGKPCYGATQLRRAYGIDKLTTRHVTGRGATVAIVNSYGDPNIQHDLDVYDAAYGLPHTQVETRTWGSMPPWDDSDPIRALCAAETALDVESVHAMAPDAYIIVIATGDYQSAGTYGMTSLMDAIGWWTSHRRIDVISMSWGTYELNFSEQAGQTGDYHLLTQERHGLQTAAAHHTTLIAADGDTGATGPNLAGTGLYSVPTVAWPASDPLVTAVSATELHADDAGVRTSPDTAWVDDGRGVATGGGLSAVFTRPRYQDQARAVVGAQRGLGDVAMVGSTATPVWLYSTYNPFQLGQPGWLRVAGTSVAAPLFAGIVADAAGLAGHPLGALNPTLYRLNTRGSGLSDVTAGCNTANGITGYCADLGYDLPSGLGSVADAGRLAPALAHRR